MVQTPFPLNHPVFLVPVDAAGTTDPIGSLGLTDRNEAEDHRPVDLPLLLHLLLISFGRWVPQVFCSHILAASQSKVFKRLPIPARN